MLITIEQMLRHFEFELRRILNGRLLGDHRQNRQGDGYEIREITPYEPGDSFRDVDHKQTAKHGSYQVRRTFAELDVDIWLLLDVRRAQHAHAGPVSKFDHALHLLLMAYAWTRTSTSRLGAIRLGSEGGVLAAGNSREIRQSRPYALELLEWLRLSPRPQVGRFQPIARSLLEANEIIRRPSVVYVASDSNDLAVLEPLAILSERHELTFINVRDAVDDMSLNVTGWINERDADTGVQDSGYASRGRLLAEQKKRATNLESFEESVSGLPMSYLRVQTTDNPLRAFIDFAQSYRYQERRWSA